MKHLWECDHPYYFDGNHYFGTGWPRKEVNQQYQDLDSFLTEWKESDLDYSLVFRWDWIEPPDRPSDRSDFYRDGELRVNFLMQRKGYHLQARVSVCRADEPQVIEFLKPRADRMRLLWEPILDGQLDALSDGSRNS